MKGKIGDIKWLEEKPEATKEEVDKELTQEESVLAREAKVALSGRNLLVRIPKDITKALGINKGDTFIFEVKPSKEDKPAQNTFKIRR